MKNQLKSALKNLDNFLLLHPRAVYITIILIIIVDQLSKLLVLRYRILPVYFNDAVAFSLPIPWFLPWIFLSTVIVFSYVIPSFKLRVRSFFSEIVDDSVLRFSLAFVAAGGLSNLVDRVVHSGVVIDFIDLRIWPVFNLADVSIVCGLLLFLGSSYIKSSIGSTK